MTDQIQRYQPVIQHSEQYPTDYSTGIKGSVLTADPAPTEPGMVVRVVGLSGSGGTNANVQKIAGIDGATAASRDNFVPVGAPQVLDTGNSPTLTNTTLRTVSVTTTIGSNTITSSGLFLASDLGSYITATGIPGNAMITKFTSTSSVDFTTDPFAVSRTATANGTTTATLYAGGVGPWFRTRSLGFVRQLLVWASNVASGLGALTCFQYSEDGVNATINEVRAITSFATVRRNDLINAGEWFRVMTAPTRILTSSEFIFTTTTEMRFFDGPFVHLPDQSLEKQNFTMDSIQAFLKLWGPDALSRNVLGDSAGRVAVTGTVGTYTGQAGVSGTVNVPSGAVVRSYAAQSGSTAASLTVPGVSGTITVPGSNQAQTQFADNPDPGTMVGPCSFTFSNTAAYVVIWTQ